MVKKDSIFREAMNCEKYTLNRGITALIHTGSGELTPDKISKKSVRWNKTPGMNDEGTVNEAGTSDPSGMMSERN